MSVSGTENMDSQNSYPTIAESSVTQLNEAIVINIFEVRVNNYKSSIYYIIKLFLFFF